MKTQYNSKLVHPTKTLISADEFRALDCNKYIIQRKFDGRLTAMQFGGDSDLCIKIAAELVEPKSGLLSTVVDRALIASNGKFFVPLTLLSVNDQDVTGESYGWCFEEMKRLCFEAYLQKFIALTFYIGDTMGPSYAGSHESITGEGLCAHPKDAPWGNMLCWKRTEIYICRVTHLWGGKSVEIEETNDSLYQRRARSESPKAIYQAISRVAITAQAADQLRVGSIVRVEGLCQTDNHSIREGKLCNNWLIKL